MKNLRFHGKNVIRSKVMMKSSNLLSILESALSCGFYDGYALANSTERISVLINSNFPDRDFNA